MEENKKLIMIDEAGKEIEYEILLTFKWMKTNKFYVVYTDNSYDAEFSINLFAAIYDPEDSTVLEEITTDEEWEEVEKRIKELQEMNRKEVDNNE